jgi:hypothetical protein
MSSGAVQVDAASTPAASSSPAAPDTCRAARKGLAYYQRQVRHWRSKMGTGGFLRDAGRTQSIRRASCPRLRYLANLWRTKAIVARQNYEQWSYEWEWQRWLPDKFARVGACETGYGKRPGSWTWDSGTYVSAFGIYRPAYAQFARSIGQPAWDDAGVRTPRQQYLVASAIQRRFGWGAWGCGGA